MPRELLYEWMHRFEGDYGVIRVWARVTRPPTECLWEFQEQAQAIKAAIEAHELAIQSSIDSGTYTPRPPYCDVLAELDFVNAVE